MARRLCCDADGFQLVRRGRRAKKSLVLVKEYHPDGAPDVDLITASVLSTKHEQSIVDFAALVVDLLKDVKCEELVCYGLGLFGTCYIARHQLALLIHLASAMQVKRVLVYDPLFRLEEKKSLIELGCQCILDNELCRRSIDVETVFYMPHCGQAMYNNLLWANWSPQNLSKMTLIGNSFQNYWERSPKQQTESFIFDAMHFCHEQTLPSFKDATIFNDLSVHTFPMARLTAAPLSLWRPRPPPCIDPSDPEVITD